MVKEPTNLLLYFVTYLKNWIKRNDLSQTEAARRLNTEQSQINGILNFKRGLSIQKLESICIITGKSGLDALIEGKKSIELSLNPKKANDNIFSEEQLATIEDFKIALLAGGEGIELITDNVKKLANRSKAKKQKPPLPPREKLTTRK